MKQRQLSRILLTLLFMIPASAYAQAWSGILDPSRATNWANTGSGIIQARNTVCASPSLVAGSAAAAANTTAINNAIAGCAAGDVVSIPAGTWYVNGVTDSNVSNITIRGAGPTQTKLIFLAGSSCGGNGGDFCVIPTNNFWSGSSWVQPGGSNAATWSGGYTQNTTSITLSKVGSSGLNNGQVIILDQANDTSDTGGYMVCDSLSPLACHLTSETGSGGRTIGGVDYSQEQMVTVTAGCATTCSGSGSFNLTISPGLRANNWRASQNPGAWWGASVTGVGIENMTLDHSSSTSSESGIFLYTCNQCWVKNVRDINSNRDHIWLYLSTQDVVRDSYLYGTQNGAQESYGVEFGGGFDTLVENNIFDHVTAPVMDGMGSAGNVIAYNYSVNSVYNVSSSFLEDVFASHDAGNYMDLFEGNDFMYIYCDQIHGTGGLQTYFRNWITGWQAGKTRQTQPISALSYCRGINIVGNVLGTPGYHNQYQATPTVGAASACDTSIYQLGWGSGECGANGAGIANDSLVTSTLLRWGNFDVVNNSVQWKSSEIPTTGTTYINGNPVPGSTVLPPSLYLSARPPFWPVSTLWPAVGPDVSQGTGPGGFSYSNPAQACFAVTAIDSTYAGVNILRFDANVCYLLPPTGILAAAH